MGGPVAPSHSNIRRTSLGGGFKPSYKVIQLMMRRVKNQNAYVKKILSVAQMVLPNSVSST